MDAAHGELERQFVPRSCGTQDWKEEVHQGDSVETRPVAFPKDESNEEDARLNAISSSGYIDMGQDAYQDGVVFKPATSISILGRNENKTTFQNSTKSISDCDRIGRQVRRIGKQH